MDGLPWTLARAMNVAQGRCTVKVLRNTVGSFLTGTAIADAVMALHLALTRRHQVELIDIPYIDDHGDPSRVQLAVGWQVSLVTQNHASQVRELLEPGTIRAITDRTPRTSDPVSVAFTLQELSDVDWDEDGSLLT